MVLNVYGKSSLRAFVGANCALVLLLPSILSPVYRHFISDWWIHILTLYVLLATAVTRSAFKDYHFKVTQCPHVGNRRAFLLTLYPDFAERLRTHTSLTTVIKPQAAKIKRRPVRWVRRVNVVRSRGWTVKDLEPTNQPAAKTCGWGVKQLTSC